MGIKGIAGIAHFAGIIVALVQVALAASLVGQWNNAAKQLEKNYDNTITVQRSPSFLNVMVASAVLSVFTLLYSLFCVRNNENCSSTMRRVGLALEGATLILLFAGSVALAAKWGGVKCYGRSWCNVSKAVIGIGFILWGLFMGLVITDALETVRSSGKISHPTV